VPYVVGQVAKESPAAEAGFEVGDSIVGIDSMNYTFFDQYKEYITAHEEAKMDLHLYRQGQKKTVSVKPNENGIIGLAPKGPPHFFEYETLEYGFVEAIGAGFVKGYRFLADQIKAFGQMFAGKIDPSESLGGFGTIASLFPTEWEWKAFWTITAILSLILGFMNLLPIPALDGGHVLFLLYEMVTGRKPSDKFMEYATLVGMIILLALLLYANGLDILRAFS
jgi:regulator of sigma E protease